MARTRGETLRYRTDNWIKESKKLDNFKTTKSNIDGMEIDDGFKEVIRQWLMASHSLMITCYRHLPQATGETAETAAVHRNLSRVMRAMTIILGLIRSANRIENSNCAAAQKVLKKLGILKFLKSNTSVELDTTTEEALEKIESESKSGEGKAKRRRRAIESDPKILKAIERLARINRGEIDESDGNSDGDDDNDPSAGVAGEDVPESYWGE